MEETDGDMSFKWALSGCNSHLTKVLAYWLFVCLFVWLVGFYDIKFCWLFNAKDCLVWFGFMSHQIMYVKNAQSFFKHINN